MCGIAGWNLTDKAPDVFYTCLAIDMIERGVDSWGLYDGVTITKGLDSLATSVPGSAIASLHGFLHTRHATTGKATTDNAHPFRIGNLVGAHNGIIDNHAELNLKHERKCAVDSMHIFEHISAGLPLSDLQGYGAIEYHEDGAYYIGRCNEGVLSCALTSLGVVWASTEYAIKLACLQAGVELKTMYTVEAGKMYRAETDALYETDMTFQMGKRDSFAKDWRSFGKGKDLTAGDEIYGLQSSHYFDEMSAIAELQEYGIDWSHKDESWEVCQVCEFHAMTNKFEGENVCAECILECISTEDGMGEHRVNGARSGNGD